VGPGKRVFAVGDIHGRLDLLDFMLKKITMIAAAKPLPDNSLIFLGDYVDRGPSSRGVIERLLRLKLPGWKTVFLRGNHDQAVLDFIKNENSYRHWRDFGAPETLFSYGVLPPLLQNKEEFARAREEFATAIPQDHFDFFNGLPYSHTEGDFFFVHAGVRPGFGLSEQRHKDMLWIRDEFLLHRRMFEKVIVHGHSPTPQPVKLANRIGIDTGAHATGRLTVAILEGETCTFVDSKEKILPAAEPPQLACA
jgi:serine/threonine protein phosphatase 1